jgi:hypothetical protein
VFVNHLDRQVQIYIAESDDDLRSPGVTSIDVATLSKPGAETFS